MIITCNLFFPKYRLALNKNTFLADSVRNSLVWRVSLLSFRSVGSQEGLDGDKGTRPHARTSHKEAALVSLFCSRPAVWAVGQDPQRMLDELDEV